MGYLTKNWLTNGLIDFEYKKYIILSYLKDVQQHFSDKKLYPILTDLIEHYQNLKTLKAKKKRIDVRFPKRIVQWDIEHSKIHYRKKINDSDLLAELESIVEYGLIRFEEQVQIGKDMVERIKETITIEQIGISPLYNDEGYLFVSAENSKTLRIYKYFLSPLKGLKAVDDQIKTHFIGTREKSISNTYEQIKREMVKLDKEFQNPATYSIYSTAKFPYFETYLPIAKKMLRNQLAA